MKIIFAVLLCALTVLVSILIGIHGWGLEIKSIWWLVGGGVFQLFVMSLAEIIKK